MISTRKGIEFSLRFWTHKASPLRSGCRDPAGFCTVVESRNAIDVCNVVESPELPDWVKYCEGENTSLDEGFVLPKIVEWAVARKLDGDLRKDGKRIVDDFVDGDVVNVADILKERFDSPDDVCSSLSGCGEIDLSERLVEKILLRFRHDWIPAYGFFKWAGHKVGFMHMGKSYNLMVDILGMSRKFDLMWELVEEMSELGGLVTLETMAKVMRRLCKCEKYDDAVEAFDKFERLGIVRETAAMNILIESLVKEKNVERAYGVYLELKDKIRPNNHTFNILVHGWCKARKYDEARQVIEEMEKHGYHPDVVSYTCIVEYYCREKDFRKVDGILDEMHQKGCPPNVVTYTIIMLALGKAKEVNEALNIYHKLKQNGCAPDASFYSALIFILSKSGRFKDVCDLFDDMLNQNVVPDVLTYNTMIAAACMHSREEYALELLKEMEGKSCSPNLKTYIPLLKVCCEKKWMKVLNYLLADMFHKNISLDLSTYCLLVDRLCKSGKLEHACSFVEQMVFKGLVPRNNTYTLLMNQLEQKGMHKSKQQIEDLMLKGAISSCQNQGA